MNFIDTYADKLCKFTFLHFFLHMSDHSYPKNRTKHIIFGNQRGVSARGCFCAYFLYLTYKYPEIPIYTCSNRGFETDRTTTNEDGEADLSQFLKTFLPYSHGRPP